MQVCTKDEIQVNNELVISTYIIQDLIDVALQNEM
jgi:hypothetical protein